MTIEVEENDYTCGFCKHYNHKEDCCWLARDMFFADDEHCCIYWEEDKDELTDEERRDILGDRKAHEIMETEGWAE